MAPIVFSTSSDLAAWLKEHNFFFEGYVAHLEPLPKESAAAANPPNKVSFELGCRANNAFYAGQTRRYFRVRLDADQVTTWTFDRKGEYEDSRRFAENTNIEDVQVEAGQDPIGLLIDENIHLSCGTIAIEVLKERFEQIVPQLSGRTVVIRTS
jgi:hypothetical protein